MTDEVQAALERLEHEYLIDPDSIGWDDLSTIRQALAFAELEKKALLDGMDDARQALATKDAELRRVARFVEAHPKEWDEWLMRHA